MARLNVNGRIVNVFSTHLDHQSSSTRLTQVKQLVAWADNHAEQRIIAGDFNGGRARQRSTKCSRPTTTAGRSRRAKGLPCRYPGNPDGNTRNTRIDYVWLLQGRVGADRDPRAGLRHEGAPSRTSDHDALIVTYKVRYAPGGVCDRCGAPT